MRKYIALVDNEEVFVSTKKTEIASFAKKSINDGAESVDIYAATEYGRSYQGSFYDDGEKPRGF